MRRKSQLPELLAPAGSFEALIAAVEAGADAVYFGGGAFHARAMAQNFDREEIRRAILYLHLHHAKAYITLNTLLFDREYQDALAEARFYYESGADALICADVGFIRRLREELPNMPIHVSTQAFVHSTEGAEVFARMGAERVVVARELSKENISSIVENSSLEVEIFLHGAVCVCHSGQCLFSSAVGGRSGNRGQCAQPCRLPYEGGYWLSLMDMSLAKHVPWLVQSGVASLKIEGRMKSPHYVYHTTKLFRTLLDQRRAATEEEINGLKRIFCRGEQFSDHYFAARPLLRMTGVRTEKEKAQSREESNQSFLPKKVNIKAEIEILPETPVKITLNLGDKQATAYGPVPSPAQNAPLTEKAVKERLSKLGDHFFLLKEEDISLTLAEGLFLTAGQVNQLRRQAAGALEEQFVLPIKTENTQHANAPSAEASATREGGQAVSGQSAVFYRAKVLADLSQSIKDKFAVLYIPLEQWEAELGANGVVLPPAVFDSQWDDVDQMLSRAKAQGAKYALVSSMAQIERVRSHGLIPMGDLRVSVTSRQTKAVLAENGLFDAVLSPELTLPQARDVGGRVVVYGRLPLMLLERCVMREKDGCDQCEKHPLVDRTGTKFPIFRTYPHRNLLFNAHPTYMGDKKDALYAAGLRDFHYLFTAESAKEIAAVMDAFEKGKAIQGKIKRFPTEKV